MKRACVIDAGYAEHPESGADLLRVTVDQPYASGGVRCPTTDLWVERAAPAPDLGEAVEWDGHHVWIRSVRYRKREYDSPTNMPLH